MPAHDNLQSYARAHLLRTDATMDLLLVEAFIKSETFSVLAQQFESRIGTELGKFRPNQPPGTLSATTTATRPEQTVEPVDFQVLKPATAEEPPTASPAANVAPGTSAAAAPPAPERPTSEPNATDAQSDELPTATTGATPAPTAVTTAAGSASEQYAAGKGSAAPDPRPPERAGISFRLKNARVGEVYAQKLIAVPEDSPPVIFADISMADDAGVIGNKNTGQITGTPMVVGEHNINIAYHFADEPAKSRRAVAKLIVNPDPKTMWKSLPSNRDDTYWKPDEDAGMVEGADFRIVAASKRGRSHAHVGGFRDDDFHINYLPESDWYVAVVSDGAGSATYSRRGSQLICGKAGTHLLNCLNGELGADIAVAAEAYYTARSQAADALRLEGAKVELHKKLYGAVGHAAYHAVKAIHDECSTRTELNAHYKDFSSTALIAACKRFKFGTLCTAYWVGDGAAGIYGKKKGITLLGEVDAGEFSGQTKFLDNAEVTPEVLFKRTRFELVDDMTALILMTDGVSDPKFETEAKLSRAGVWDELWLEMEQAASLQGSPNDQDQKLLAWLNFWSQGNHDDRTIAIIY